MKYVVIFAALLSAAPALAQNAPAAPATPAAASTPAALNVDSPIESLAESPTAKAALVKQFPEILGHAAYEQFKSMSLRQLAQLAGGLITDEKSAACEAEVGAKK